jgi:DMSO/TMAO reductase YedYZ heme-binding membrane subunit
VSSQLWWYAARSGGLVAWAMLAAGVLWGLALSTKVLGPKPRPNWMLDLHRFLGGAAVVFTGVHVGSILLDTYTHFGLADVLVPFTGTWHPAAVAWGIVSMYLLLAVQITSMLRRRLSKRAWRRIHFLSFPLFGLATLHAMTAGTDRHSPAMRIALLGTTAVVLIATAIRIQQATSEPDAPTPRPVDRDPVGAGRR